MTRNINNFQFYNLCNYKIKQNGDVLVTNNLDKSTLVAH